MNIFPIYSLLLKINGGNNKQGKGNIFFLNLKRQKQRAWRNPHINSQVVSDKVVRTCIGERTAISTNGVGQNKYSHAASEAKPLSFASSKSTQLIIDKCIN